MRVRDGPSDRDLDDWFHEPEGTTPGDRRSPEPHPGADDSPAAEDWLDGAETSPGAGPRFSLARVAAHPRQAVAVAALAVVVLAIGLAAGGVFSGGARPRALATATPPAATTSAPARAKPASVPAPTTALAPGDQGPQVRALQRALASLRYSSGGIDGRYGPATRAAVARFQRASRLTADGIFGPQTLAALAAALANSG